MREILKEFDKRLKKLDSYNKVFVFYHYDLDGVASASILHRWTDSQRLNVEYFPITRGKEGSVIEKIRSESPDKILFIDYGPREELQNFLKDLDYSTVSILDHHLHNDDLERFDYVTLPDYEEEYNAMAYLLYELVTDYGVRDIDWLAFIGAYWDKGLEETRFYNPQVYEENLDEMLPFNLVASFEQLKGSEVLFHLFNTSSSKEEAFNMVNGKDIYRDAKEAFDREIEEVEDSLESREEHKLYIYEIETSFKHIRIFVDYLSFKGPGGTKVFVLPEDGQTKFSFRTDLDIHLPDIIEKVAKKNESFRGGGHSKACGGFLKSRFYDKVISDFIYEYQETYEKLE